MISGIKIHVAGTELFEHLLGRANHHKERAAHYVRQVASLKAQGDEFQEDPVSSVRRFREDPLSSLERSANEHTEKYGYFKFLADHLPREETYELEEHDLAKIEIVARYL
jgi:hypothetical protein